MLIIHLWSKPVIICISIIKEIDSANLWNCWCQVPNESKGIYNAKYSWLKLIV